MLIEQDFPICYAEEVNHNNSDMIYYIDWLDDNSQFPSLSAPSNSKSTLDEGNWELMLRKEMDEDEFIVDLGEDDLSWAKVDVSDHKTEGLFTDIVQSGNNSMPAKRQIKAIPLYAPKPRHVNVELLEEEEGDLGSQLLSIRKSQSERASNLTRRRLKHDMLLYEDAHSITYQVMMAPRGTTIKSWNSGHCEHVDSTQEMKKKKRQILNTLTSDYSCRYANKWQIKGSKSIAVSITDRSIYSVNDPVSRKKATV